MHDNFISTFYMICCKQDHASCYYTNGVGCVNIPFKQAKYIKLQKITLYHGNKFIKNLLPAFILFQKQARKYIRWVLKQRTVKVFLQRQLTGPQRI
jgi:hypothetical protein